jgi:Zn-dependent M28 family amino/carboxypeptidase
VVISAHLDGLGVRRAKEGERQAGDNIYNGAMDNASGIAVMLEAARLFSREGARPKRSILFVALTGEEKGLLGSDYFASHPTVPAGAMVANVNLDMPMLSYDFSQVIAFGADHSTLAGPVARAAALAGVALQPDPWPEQGIFTRSDHYMFVRQGIPSVMVATGLKSFKAGEDPAAVWGKFFATHYHEPSDDMALPFNWDAAERFAQLNYLIALEIANADERPRWKKGDFFGETFSKGR